MPAGVRDVDDITAFLVGDPPRPQIREKSAPTREVTTFRGPHSRPACYTRTPMSIATLTTERLILEPLRLADAPAFQRLFPHWEVVRYLSSPAVPWPYPVDGAVVYCRDVALPAMARGDEWHWTLRPREAPDAIIGSIGLMNAVGGNRGFWLAPPWQGQGLMTEACEASADFWFGVLGRAVLREPRASANHASIRIAVKTGMRLVATEMRHFVAGALPAELWEITRAEWQARRKTR